MYSWPDLRGPQSCFEALPSLFLPVSRERPTETTTTPPSLSLATPPGGELPAEEEEEVEHTDRVR